MLVTLGKGFIIGLFVSSPMGPINMLTIQRTLNRGRWHGFASGMGAMLSDLIYALITMLGMNLVSDFLVKNDTFFKIIGSIILTLFGIVVFRTNPLKEWSHKATPNDTKYFKYFISSFILTFSNIAIILVFIGLFVRFSFNPLMSGLNYIIFGMIGFVSAAFLWWFLLTSLVSKLRGRFNRKGLIYLNRIIGSILTLIGVGGVLVLLF